MDARSRMLVASLLLIACASDPEAPPSQAAAGTAANAGTDALAGTGSNAGTGASAGTGANAGTGASAGTGAVVDAGETMQPPVNAAAGTSAPDPGPAFGADADVFAWSTESFTLDAGQERYLCFASTLAENLVVDGYNTDVEPFVHHLIFSRTRAPDPEGFSECDIAFRSTWDTLFISGAGDTTLEFPDDAGHQLPTGTQLVVQMHLLNATDAPVDGSLTINMRRSKAENPRPVSSFIFGTAAVELPPMQESSVVGTCAVRQPLQLIAAFPHMHLLGTAMTFEVGAAGGAMREVFKRDPFDFDNQRIENIDVTLAPGDVTRTSCTFMNTHDETISYGESTKNEMCYLIGFAIDNSRMGACLEVLPPRIF